MIGKQFASRRRSLPLLLASLALLFPAAAHADADLTDQASATDAYTALVKGLDPTGDPARAAAAELQFVKDHPRLYPACAGNAVTQAYLLYRGRGDYAGILETADLALTQLPPAYIPNFLAFKADALNKLDRAPEAEKLMKDNWRYPERDFNTFVMMVVAYFDALDKEGKHDQAIAEIEQTIWSKPKLLDDSTQGHIAGWLYTDLVNDLLATGHTDEALSWTKLRFVECGFNADSVDRSGAQLMHTWTAVSQAQTTAREFFAAQTDTAATNPLAAVPLPAIDADTRAALLAAAATVHDRVSAYIALGMMAEAMNAARQSLLESTPGAIGPEQVCRVFKAADLNLLRANQFAQFYQTGAGPNPLPDFLKQFPPGGTAAP